MNDQGVLLIISIGVGYVVYVISNLVTNRLNNNKNKEIDNHRLNLNEKTLPKGFPRQYKKPDDIVGGK